MKNKDGYEIRCEHAEWRIIDNNDNKDYVCTFFGTSVTGWHFCYCNDNCREYKPITEVDNVKEG